MGDALSGDDDGEGGVIASIRFETIASVTNGAYCVTVPGGNIQPMGSYISIPITLSQIMAAR